MTTPILDRTTRLPLVGMIDSVPVFALESGPLTEVTADQLVASVDDALGFGYRGIVVDVSAVSTTGYAGVSGLAKALQLVRRYNGRLGLVAPAGGRMERLLSVSGSDTLRSIRFYRDVKTAADAVR